MKQSCRSDVPKTAQRVQYLDAAKGIGMLLIMWGHLSQISEPVFTWFACPKIAVFYLASGILLDKKNTAEHISQDPEKRKRQIKKRLLSLGVPYVVFSVLIMLFHAAVALLHHHALLTTLGTDLWDTVTLRGISTLWFFTDTVFCCVHLAAMACRFI